ncbi:MAG: class I SAM-dependent methyltransferase [Alicyclobacillus macrosporangiidus]|uniref:class I SAM-dependent methyltransferase n=1 Tax=Alicyclobacillus macrosporangiidus TaxID=392015 RepID=UPI0026EE38BF|nr:class I SAM-dependent methyltransferase [Alicyclobacillus macrosporangiidus]MCL6599664.1 class I SAM-dependent methyltransferase [Alicyclobacillus macrosporangiidus]
MQVNDNLEEYRDPVTYDSEYGKVGLELPFFEGLARETGGPILELACGTGRVTIPLAQRGFDVTGVDITPQMLERAKQKAAEKAVRVNWILGDCRHLRLDKQFGLVFMTGNAFQAFLDRKSQEDMLQRVHEHLREDGLFAFETRNPNLMHLFHDEADKEVSRFTDERGYEVTVWGSERYDPVTQIQHCITYRRWTDSSGVTVTRQTRIDLRYVFPQELEALLHYNGFTLLRRYGYFDKRPFDTDSPLMVCVCNKRA